MVLKIAANRSPVGIYQKTTATGVWDGQKPSTAVTFANGANRFADSEHAGLFDFEQQEAVTVDQYVFDLGASVAYTVAVVNLDTAGAPIAGEELQIDAGTARYVSSRVPLVLLTGQALRVTATGAAIRQGQVVATINKR